MPDAVIGYIRRAAASTGRGGASETRRATPRRPSASLARAALDKKAEALVVLDLQGLSSVADYFLVCSGALGPAARHHRRRRARRAEGARACGSRHREGTAASGWLLLDSGDVVVHVFLDETRAFYALERLWGDAPTLPLDASPLPGGATARGDEVVRLISPRYAW